MSLRSTRASSNDVSRSQHGRSKTERIALMPRSTSIVVSFVLLSRTRPGELDTREEGGLGWKVVDEGVVQSRAGVCRGLLLVAQAPTRHGRTASCHRPHRRALNTRATRYATHLCSSYTSQALFDHTTDPSLTRLLYFYHRNSRHPDAFGPGNDIWTTI